MPANYSSYIVSVSRSKPRVLLEDLGMTGYQEAWDYQMLRHRELIDSKRAARDDQDYRPRHRLLLCEHPPVYTLGRSGKLDHLLLTEDELTAQGMTFHKINRGGDITYHGPGQLVVYPILDLEDYYRDVHRYVRELEEVVIRVARDYDVRGTRIEDYTGVWVEGAFRQKICAIGVHLSRWVSLHGLALNVDPDLSHFDHIIPCGIQEDDKAVSSLAALSRLDITMSDVKEKLVRHFAEVFDCDVIAE